ncbi:MAG: 3-phosphoshikimate 1-carboxyvinyltransferase [Bacteroidetes bacterium]|nr:MAG: 3-phosphoshikimate 1-carboxyvinyltransferase [Bacteroidota bacterium]
MEVLHLSRPDRVLQGTLALEGSKSLSNRALIILALAGADAGRWLDNLSAAADTRLLQRLLETSPAEYDAGDAGTTFRFLTAYLALQPGDQVLTGSRRMQERPIGALVEALHSLGADIRYLGREGYPPLLIGSPDNLGRTTQEVRIRADVSSQFLSALLLIGPCLPQALVLIPEGRLVSRPYIHMTLQLMRHFGAVADWSDDRIVVAPGGYRPQHLTIEADWSAASYWYALAALADCADLTLNGLTLHSWQGDAVLVDMLEAFGLKTTPAPAGVRIQKIPGSRAAHFKYDFLDCPDLAQSLAVLCAGLGVPAFFSGLETLAIKETDRTAAIQAELAKVGVLFRRMEGPDTGPGTYQLSGKARWSQPPRFSTYGDHRMAMSLAALAMLGPVGIEHPAVVKKSYPAFWLHLEQLGFELNITEQA